MAIDVVHTTALAAASQRAYRGDLLDLSRWCSSIGVDLTDETVDERLLFAYFVHLAHMGLSASTVRRRMTSIRSSRESGASQKLRHLSASPRLRSLERRLHSEVDDRVGVLVLSDDSVIRAGLSTVLSETGALAWGDRVADVDHRTLIVWDYILVWCMSWRGADPFGAIDVVRGFGQLVSAHAPVVVVHPGPITPTVQLRMAEAGVRYALPQHWVSQNIFGLSSRLKSAEIPTRFHLKTPLALRQELGLSLSGDLGSFLETASHEPAIIWAGHLPQDMLPIPRKSVTRLRAMAMEVAGLRAPEYAKYANSLRSAPRLPEWQKVRALVRQSWALPDTQYSTGMRDATTYL